MAPVTTVHSKQIPHLSLIRTLNCPIRSLPSCVYSRTNCMSTLKDEIGSLSVAEKCDLLDLLWESIEAEPLVLTDEQRVEIDDRIAKYLRNPSDVIPWEDIKGRLFAKQ